MAFPRFSETIRLGLGPTMDGTILTASTGPLGVAPQPSAAHERECLSNHNTSFPGSTPQPGRRGPTAAWDTHGLSVHKQGGALGAGREHLRGADELGADPPQVVSKVTGRVTGQEAEPFLNILKGKIIPVCKGRALT